MSNRVFIVTLPEHIEVDTLFDAVQEIRIGAGNQATVDEINIPR